MAKQLTEEKRLLRISVYGALAFALLAMVWGVLEGSNVMLFDGIYSLISVGLTLVSLISAAFMEKKDNHRFPFGKEMMEPMVILGKFLVIGILCLFAFFSGLTALLSGGHEVDNVSGAIYAILAAVGCYLVYFFLHRKGKNMDSGFVDAESQQWLMDFFLSLAVLAGFVSGYFMENTPLASYTRFIDPLMVMLLSGYFLKVPITSIGKQVREVLDMAADEKYLKRCREIVGQLEEKYGFEESFLRVSKSGQKLFIEIDFVVNPKAWQPTLSEQDMIREEILSRLQEVPLVKWLNVAFTNDRKWAL